MSLFGRKEQKKIDELVYENETLTKGYDALYAKLKEIGKYADSTPEDCTRGPWCEVCSFDRVFSISKRSLSSFSFPSEIEYVHVCGKGMSCKNFVERVSGDE